MFVFSVTLNFKKNATKQSIMNQEEDTTKGEREDNEINDRHYKIMKIHFLFVLECILKDLRKKKQHTHLNI